MSNKNEFFAFSNRELPPLLMSAFHNEKKVISVVDLGCGEGALMHILFEKGYFKNAKVTGVDISKRLIEISRKRNPKTVKYVLSDVTDTTLKSTQFDVAYSSMVIEHLDKPVALVQEIKRILKPGGKVYISTIMKKWWGIYFYRNRGKFVIDPTHTYEFKSEKELKDLMKSNGFNVLKTKTFLRKYPIIELTVKILIRLGLVKSSDGLRNLFLNNKVLGQLNSYLYIPIPGFYEINILCSKK